MTDEVENKITHIHEAPDYANLGCAAFLIILVLVIGSCTVLERSYNYEIKKLEMQLEIEKAKK